MKYEINIKGKTKKQVTKLNLSGCGLTSFPENIFDYPNLTRGRGTGTCPNLKNQRFAYLFPHPVLSWEGLYQRSGNGQFRSFMY